MLTSQLPPRRNSTTLWLILGVCLLPIVGSTALYYLAPPGDRMNYGELISPPIPLPDLSIADMDGRPVSLKNLRGKWTFVHMDTSACSASCRDKLYKMRQVRLTQGKNMDRVQRLWIIKDAGAVDPPVLKDYSGTLLLRPGEQALAELEDALPSKTNPEGHIWLIDPLGNVMLRYPPHADPSRMKNDLSRLLRVSRIE